MLDWIPEEVWRSAAESDEGSIADWILLAWSFVCVGFAAFPVGILTGCMGATHFLHKQGRESTVATCLKLVLPQSWSLWRSEEHTSELQSRPHLVCRLLL